VDQLSPWGKQHVYLLDGPRSTLAQKMKQESFLRTQLKPVGLEGLLNASLPLVLPRALRISAIEHTSRHLRVVAVERRESWERDESLDKPGTTEEGETIDFRAYVKDVQRGLVIFEWDLLANVAAVRITQLPARFSYEEKRDEFYRLCSWIPFADFQPIDLRKVVRKLHEAEEDGRPEARTHVVDYRTKGGRRIMGTSASPEDPLPGEAIVDNALRGVRQGSQGHLGNFYWLPISEVAIDGNILEDRFHTIIVAYHDRINFTVSSSPEVFQYVSSRIRALAR
jgi:hypothetical protein